MTRLAAVLLVAAACGRVSFKTAIDAAPLDAASLDAVTISVVGCADGHREGYLDIARFARIAACNAIWVGELDLRAAPTGEQCGNDLGPCTVPADACAPGWHICARSGDVTELQVLDVSECDNLVVGRYVAASTHCSGPAPCAYSPLQMFECPTGTGGPCTQPICCGTDCAVPACSDGVWAGGTRENTFVANGCANTLAADQNGVLCCRD